MLKKTLVLVITSLVPTFGYACTDAYLIGAYSYRQLIDEAGSIVLATLKRAENVESPVSDAKDGGNRPVHDVLAAARGAQQKRAKARYSFAVSEVLLGQANTEITLETYSHVGTQKQHDFKRHQDYRFWLDGGGLTQVNSSCDLVPLFEEGKTYLLILGARTSRKSYELIREPSRDAWYKEVKRLVLFKE